MESDDTGMLKKKVRYNIQEESQDHTHFIPRQRGSSFMSSSNKYRKRISSSKPQENSIINNNYFSKIPFLPI